MPSPCFPSGEPRSATDTQLWESEHTEVSDCKQLTKVKSNLCIHLPSFPASFSFSLFPGIAYPNEVLDHMIRLRSTFPKSHPEELCELGSMA